MLGRIARQLKTSVSAIMDGITQEQADQITELTIQECDVELLKYFKNLKTLRIKPNLRDMGTTFDLDISDMEKLESLDIIATDGITNINIDNVPNLNAVNISENKRLEKTTGLEDLKELKTLLMVDNNALKEIPDIQSIAHGPNIESLQVDFDWLHFFEEKYGDLDKIQDDDVMKNKVALIEKMGRFIYPFELDKGIEAEKVDCRYWDKEDGEITEYIHPKNANHSIIRFKTKDGWFYSDPTFDSMDPCKRKFFFKTKSEMINVHGLSISEMNVDSPEVRPDEYSNERLSEILTEQLRKTREKEKQASKDDKGEYKDQPETKNRPDDNPENWRKSFRFNISPEQYQEVLEIHKQKEEEFKQSEIETPEDKIEPTEHGIK